VRTGRIGVGRVRVIERKTWRAANPSLSGVAVPDAQDERMVQVGLADSACG